MINTSRILSEILQSYSLNRYANQKGKLHEKYQAVLTVCHREYGDVLVADPFQSGSLAKGTAINVKFDLDMVVAFKHGAFDRPENLYQTIGILLQRNGYHSRYQRVSFGIPVGKSFLDVVPGMEINRNNYSSSCGDLLLWDSQKKNTIKTNIQRQVSHLKKQGPAVLEVIRFLKIWKYHHSINLKSFMLELLAINALKSSNSANLEDRLLLTFRHISQHLHLPLKDPGNSSNDVLKDMSPVTRNNVANRMEKIAKKLTIAFKEGDHKMIKRIFPKR